jgi:hypothetical protein
MAQPTTVVRTLVRLALWAAACIGGYLLLTLFSPAARATPPAPPDLPLVAEARAETGTEAESARDDGVHPVTKESARKATGKPTPTSSTQPARARSAEPARKVTGKPPGGVDVPGPGGRGVLQDPGPQRDGPAVPADIGPGTKPTRPAGIGLDSNPAQAAGIASDIDPAQAADIGPAGDPARAADIGPASNPAQAAGIEPTHRTRAGTAGLAPPLDGIAAGLARAEPPIIRSTEPANVTSAQLLDVVEELVVLPATRTVLPSTSESDIPVSEPARLLGAAPVQVNVEPLRTVGAARGRPVSMEPERLVDLATGRLLDGSLVRDLGLTAEQLLHSPLVRDPSLTAERLLDPLVGVVGLETGRLGTIVVWGLTSAERAVAGLVGSGDAALRPVVEGLGLGDLGLGGLELGGLELGGPGLGAVSHPVPIGSAVRPAATGVQASSAAAPRPGAGPEARFADGVRALCDGGRLRPYSMGVGGSNRLAGGGPGAPGQARPWGASDVRAGGSESPQPAAVASGGPGVPVMTPHVARLVDRSGPSRVPDVSAPTG